MVISFYKEDDISRPMPGEKDCFTIEKNDEKIKVQKKLSLVTLKKHKGSLKTCTLRQK